ncbi:MAG: response regulator [candidate division Zixibacteria bacterium]|nr:response regulator [candidate division Zixibacteria bacterium]
MAKHNPVKMLVIDGDRDYRTALIQALEAIDYVAVVGAFENINSAIAQITKLAPEIVLLDFNMPAKQAKSAIDSIKRIDETIEVILVSESTNTTSKSSLKALDLGALYFIRKPPINSVSENAVYFNKYLRPIINLHYINRTTEKVRQAEPAAPPSIATPPSPTPSGATIKRFQLSDYDIVAIGTSLGGPKALYELIPALPADFPLPVVIVQHMPKGFTESLSANLDAKSKLIVVEARGGEKLQGGYVYLATGGKHLEIARNPRMPGRNYITRSIDSDPVHGCKPAVDVMFHSLVGSIQGGILAVVLTGMGVDGLAGVRALKAHKNCYCITQDQASCAVYGMPAEIVKAGLSDLSLSPVRIAERLTQIVQLRKVASTV